MASKSPTVIDGFSSVRAVRHSGKAGDRPKTRSSPTELPGLNQDPPIDSQAPPPPATRIGHTVLPDKHYIVCYECGYAFTLQGKIRDSYCAKCRKLLKVEAYTIDGDWESDIKTIGTIEVTATGVVRKASLVAMRIVLAGNIEEATVKACQTLELRNGARFDPRALCAEDYTIHEDARIRLDHELECRNIEVRGLLRAKVHPRGHLRVLPGGTFQGQFHGSRLIVEDGGTLKAKIALGPGQA